MSSLPGCELVSAGAVTGVKAFDSPDKTGFKDGGVAPNFNWSQRLAFSKVVSRVAIEMVKEKPSQLLFMALYAGPSGVRTSGAAIYLAPSISYSFVEDIRLVYPNNSVVAGLFQRLFAPAAVALTLLGLAAVLFRRANQLSGQPLYWFTLGIIGYHVGVSTFGEYGENYRFQAEVASALAIMSTLVLWRLVPEKGRP